MTVLDINNVSKHFHAEPVLERLSCKINRGEKVGLIGENGCGKSTLLKMIAGVENISSGTITRPTGATVGYLAQEMEYDEERTVYQEILQVFSRIRQLADELRNLEEVMASPAEEEREQQRTMERYSHLSTEFERLGGYTYEYRIDAVLEGLRIADKKERRIASLSGGEKNVVALARILLQEPDILLLDEPANHLDFEGLEWLESFLKNYDRTVILVSHNRYLLDRVVDSILEIEHRRITRYAGNYSWYRAEKMKKLLEQQAAYQSQQKEIRRLEEMIARFEHWASMTDDPRQARRARNKQRMLDKMEKIDRPDLDGRRIDPEFAASSRAGQIALQVKGYDKSFGDRVIFAAADLHLSFGDRVGLLGPNGTGKSTLFKEIVEEAAWDHPVLRVGPQIRIGYYAQEHETLHPERTIMRELLELPGVTRDRAFGVLSRFLFGWDDMDRIVGTLSGGEKSRVQLARLMLSDVNFLLLDEPTNHLDIFSREKVEEALEEFEGSILVISHDRYFLDRIVHRIVEVDNPKLKEYAGDFTYFWGKKKEATAARQSPPTQKRKQPIVDRKKKRSADQREKRLAGGGRSPSLAKRKDPKEIGEIETRIEGLEAEKLQLEGEVAAAYREKNYKRGDKLTRDLRRLETDIDRLYAQWERGSA